MQILSDPLALQAQTRAWRREGLRISFVPTMGFLHEGHVSLMRAARAQADKVVASIFVNPTQFGPNEDFAAYPRDAARDTALAEAAGVDLLFMPTPEVMYAPDAATWVEVPSLAQGLCARSRPTHFRGACTIVAKLFHIVQPDVAFFGEKDWQQLAIIRRMVRDLMFGIEIVGCPIIREDDGLAKSSRNVNLLLEERVQAVQINQAFLYAEGLVRKGGLGVAELLAQTQHFLKEKVPAGQIDYLEAVDPASLAPVEVLTAPVLLAVAVKFSRVRLIDNRLITP